MQTIYSTRQPLTINALTRSVQFVAATALMTMSTWAAALEVKPFSSSEMASLQQQAKPVVVHFHADWCSTCIGQAKSLETLKSDSQLKGITVLVANYDKEIALKKSMNIRSQSVMVVFKGDMEVTRLSGQTQANDIKAAFVKAI